MSDTGAEDVTAFDMPLLDDRRSGERAIPREVELKYLVRDLEALRGWLAKDWGGALDGVEAGNERTVEVEDRYIDTAYGALAQAGFGARLRREDDGPVSVTVKSASHDRPAEGVGDDEVDPRALSRRVEVEGPAGAQLDPELWPPSAARELINEVRDGARLRTLFTINQRRERRTLALDDGPVAVTLDRVAVFRGARPLSSFSVLEIEAPKGSGADLRRLAALVEATGFVVPEPRSKEEIARHYVAKAAEDPTHRLPRVPTSPGIKADDPLGEAGRKVLRMHLARMLHFEAGARLGEDAEELHRMRVATRRMRAAWRVFDGAYRRKVQQRYVKELRSVARALGEVRDIDVLLEHLDDYMSRLPAPGRTALEPLRNAWRRDREVARKALVDRLDSRQYRQFVDDYLDFTESPGAAEVRLPLGQPSLVRDTAGSRILQAYERVRAYQTIITWADVGTLHALRIEGKRLRYTLEYFSEVLPVNARQLIVGVTQMQDHLGLLNDADVAARVTRDWLNLNAPLLPARSREAVGLYLDSREAEMEQLRRSFRPLWRRITGRGFRRALGVAITHIE
ncbi:MAG TPA: CHAD domain-containing protein [Anaerolineae bacterium]|nr:CHAD domain-containing protein [Anaerolineae bacterium]